MLKALRSQPKAIVQAVSKPRRTVTSWALWQQRRRWGDEASLYAVLYVEVLCQVKVDQQDFYCYKTLQMRTIMLSNPFSVDR